MSDSISSVLLPLLQDRFSRMEIHLSPNEAPVAVFPAIHPDVGDIEIYDDGDEITLVLGNFTHIHIGNFDDEISDFERREKISIEVATFLEDLFADRIELYGGHRVGGGSRLRERGPRGTISKLVFGKKSYVWSGPLRDDD